MRKSLKIYARILEFFGEVIGLIDGYIKQFGMYLLSLLPFFSFSLIWSLYDAPCIPQVAGSKNICQGGVTTPYCAKKKKRKQKKKRRKD